MPKSPKEMGEAIAKNLPAKTGRTFEQHWAHAYTVREGKVATAHLYEDTHAQAKAFA